MGKRLVKALGPSPAADIQPEWTATGWLQPGRCRQAPSGPASRPQTPAAKYWAAITPAWTISRYSCQVIESFTQGRLGHPTEFLDRFDQAGGHLTGIIAGVEAKTRLREQLAEQAAEEMVQLLLRLSGGLQPQAAAFETLAQAVGDALAQLGRSGRKRSTAGSPLSYGKRSRSKAGRAPGPCPGWLHQGVSHVETAGMRPH